MAKFNFIVSGKFWELGALLGLKFIVIPSDFDESTIKFKTTPEEFCKLLAYNKAKVVANKLDITVDELHCYFTMPKKFYWDYKNQENFFKLGAKILKAIGVERSIKR